jgi:hypothetical protein
VFSVVPVLAGAVVFMCLMRSSSSIGMVCREVVYVARRCLLSFVLCLF